MTVYREVFFSGRVQGVGFRYSVKHLAAGYEVTGWVRNLSDGRVELQVGGETSEVDAFLLGIAGSQLKRYIRETRQADITTPDPAWTGFEIRG